MPDTNSPRNQLSVSRGQMWDEVYRRISGWDADRVSKATFMVVGAGALGNEVLKNLALLNVGQILIVDFDRIEYTNLSRSVLFRESDCGKRKVDVAAASVRAINPGIKVKTIHGDIGLDVGLGVFRRVDVVMGCLDNRIARLYINRLCYKANKVWVDGAIENMSGRLHVYQPGVSCYECQLSEEEMSIIQFRMGCADIAQRNANFGRIPTTPITSSIIAAMQVQEGMKVVFEDYKHLMAKESFYYEGINNLTLTFQNPPLNEECFSHVQVDNVIEADSLSCKMSVGDLLKWLEKRFPGQNPRIALDFEVVLEVTGKASGHVSDVVIAKGHLSDERAAAYQKEAGEDLVITKSVNVVDGNFAFPKKALSELGIPPLQVLTIETDEDIYFVELSGDAEFMQF